jgi:hypothetical protein
MPKVDPDGKAITLLDEAPGFPGIYVPHGVKRWFCTVCDAAKPGKGWHKITTSWASVATHCRSSAHTNNKAGAEMGLEIPASPRRSKDPKMILNAMLRLFIFGLLPFSLAAMGEIQTLAPGFPGRKALTGLVSCISYLVVDALANLVTRATHCSIQMDGWSDRLGRRFLGVVAIFCVGDIVYTAVLGNPYIESLHETGEVCCRMLYDVVTRYGYRPIFCVSPHRRW